MMTSIRVLQCNINHSWGAQDLLVHSVFERQVSVCVVSEPVHIPQSTSWFGSTNKNVGIYINENIRRLTGRILENGRHYVIIDYDGYCIVGCYLPPSISVDEFVRTLDNISQFVYGRSRVLICGDFNARSIAWDPSVTNVRGEVLEEWAAAIDARLLNVGREPTCIRPQGVSTVDLSWCSADMVTRIEGWEIVKDVVTLSDHVFIEMVIVRGRNTEPQHKKKKIWNFKKMDVGKFAESIEWSCSTKNQEEWELNPLEDKRKWIKETVQRACDISTPVIRDRGTRKRAYWWTDAVNEKRKECIRAQRNWSRSKRRGDRGVTERLNREYKIKRKELRITISNAKSDAWRELIGTIEENPWGLPYKLVLNKLRRESQALTQTLDEDVIEELIEDLFPQKDTAADYNDWSAFRWNDEQEILPGEVFRNIKKRQVANTAPGPDGVKAIVLKKIPEILLDKIVDCYTDCLKEGTFPMEWKIANLVLIPKNVVPAGVAPKVRPICLLDDIGKIFERILADRMIEWMNENPNAQLSENQYGFRKHRSTLDAIGKVIEEVRATWDKGGVTIAVCLDIKNAFNSLSWHAIKEALKRKGFPEYIRRILDSYLSNRRIQYESKTGQQYKSMTAGVPQGSVLGPLLWNLTYDGVLNTQLEKNCRIIGYADDTIILSSAASVTAAVIAAGLQTAKVLSKIRGLGLAVSEDKTEAAIFHSKRKPELIPPVLVGSTRIVVGEKVKYLGVILDSKLTFEPHFQYVETKVNKVSRALGRLMPNLHGPGENKRRLYANTLISVIMYGAPIWSESLNYSRKNRQIARKLFRVIAIRVIAAYRTISHDAATLLARIPPLQLMAASQSKVYTRSRELLSRDTWSKEAENEIKCMEKIIMRRQWRLFLSRPEAAGLRTLNAILPNLDGWLDRSHGSINYHLTQTLSGHGCFSTYLFRIGKTENTTCEFCGAERDDTEHTMFSCPQWINQRAELSQALETDVDDTLGLVGIVRNLVDSEGKWMPIQTFATTIMKEKETEERARQRRVRHSGHRPLSEESDEDWNPD